MATFTGQLISATYDAIIKTIDNDAIGGTAKQLTDGLGNVTPLYVSTTQIGIGITPTEALQVSGNIKASLSVIATTFSGDLNGTINTATTGVTQTAGDNTTKIATTAFVQESHTGKPTGSGTGGKIPLWSGSGTSTVLTDSSITEESTQYLLTKDIRIFDTIPAITLQDSNSSGSASLGDIQWLDNAASQRAVISLNNSILGITSKQGGLNFGTNSTNALTIDGSQNSVFQGSVTTGGDVTISSGTEGGAVLLGSSASIFSEQGITFKDSDTTIQNTVAGGDIVFKTKTGAGSQNTHLTLFENNTSTFAGQVTIPLTPTANTDAASKGYVDTQIGANNELSEVLANGNTTGGTDIVVSTGDQIMLPDGSSTSPAITFSDDTNTGIYRTGNDVLNLGVGGSDAISIFPTAVYIKPSGSTELTITSTGSTFAGTVTSGQLTTVTDDNGNVFKTSSSSNKRSQIFFQDSSNTITARVGNDISGGNTSQLQFIAGSGSTPQITLNSSGNVGIGIDTPTLVAGKIVHIHGTASGVHLTDTASGTASGDGGYVAFDNPNLYIQNKEAGSMFFETSGTTRLTIDSSGNSTFAGTVTTNATADLMLSLNTTSTNGGYLRLQESSATKFFIGSRASVSGGTGTGYDIYAIGDLRFFTGAVQALNIDTSQNATFAGQVLVNSSIRSSQSSSSTNYATSNGGTLNLINTNNTNGNFSNIGGYNSNSLVTSQINFINESHSSRTGAITFNTHNGGSMPENMRITSGGDVMIGGTTTFNGVTGETGFEIYGNTAQLLINNPSYNHFTIYSASDSNIYNVFGSSGNYLIGTGNKDTSSWSENMRITSGGDVQIQNRLDFRGISSSQAANILTNETNTGTGILRLQAGGGSAAYGGGVAMYANAHSSKAGDVAIGLSAVSGSEFRVNLNGVDTSTDVLNLTRSGDMTIAGTLTQNSDIRIKENIKPLESQLEIIGKLNPVSYNKKENKKTLETYKEKKEIGFIAQEVEEILPELISENKEGIKSLAYGNMTSILVKAIQELKAEIDDLKNKCNCK